MPVSPRQKPQIKIEKTLGTVHIGLETAQALPAEDPKVPLFTSGFEQACQTTDSSPRERPPLRDQQGVLYVSTSFSYCPLDLQTSPSPAFQVGSLSSGHNRWQGRHSLARQKKSR